MRNHEDLVVWRKSRRVVLAVVQLSATAWKPWFAAMFWQLQRSALSVQLNITEGCALWYPRQLRRQLRIALGSAAETVDLLNLLRDTNAVANDKVKPLVAEEREVWWMLVSWLKKTEVDDRSTRSNHT
jgi:four helix bundle protein